MSHGEAFQVGLRIGKYELTRKLGEGGFGVLFVARDTSLDRELAIKFLHPHHSANPEVVKRFLQEARSLAKVVHPGIVTVYESAEVWGTGTPADGAAFIIMELLNGETLTSRLKNSGGRLAPATAMEICRQVASALEAAHRQGVVHRDLKPDNVMLVKDLALNLGERAKVLDFGIAKMATATPAGANNATQAGMVFGTPNYMAPEQCRSAADANHASDIYSLGCILFELVTGRTPFDGGMAELIAHHILTPAPVPSRIVPGLPAHIDDVIASMLAKLPEHRPASMTVVEAILEERRLAPAAKSGARTRTLGGARLATTPPPMTGSPMQPSQLAAMANTPHGAIGAGAAQGATQIAQPVARSSPTTLNSAAGVAAKLEQPSSSKKWMFAIPVVAIAAIVTVLAMRGGDSAEPGAEPPPAGSDSIATGSATTGSATTTTTGSAATTTTGSATTTTTGSAATTTTGSAATTTTGSAATAGSATTGSAATTAGSAEQSAAATAGSAAGSATTTAGSAATTATAGSAAGSATATAGSAATTATAGSAATKTTGTTAGSATTTAAGSAATKTTGTTAGSATTTAAGSAATKTTATTGTTAGSAATKTTGTTAGSAATKTTTAGSAATTTTTKTTGTTAGSAATKTTGTTAGSAATKTTTKTTGTTAGSAATNTTGTTKTTTTKKPPDPAQGSAAKKCQGRQCILDGNF